ncbi:rep protein [Human associated porprismacovirus 1]|uniref:Rep protein n=1 Tax=Human associated porprismacovirus 1 TaxID=2170113 RepID=A0A9E7P811_9VIRU|nr:rep protein [Human associated porprismacovirus 1]
MSTTASGQWSTNMSQMYMLTIPRDKVSKRELRIMLDKNDCHKWIIGKEEGKNGYKHWQIRLDTSNKQFFEWCKIHIPTASIRKAEVPKWDYEAKEGQYWKSSDRVDNLIQRFGEFRPNQKRAIQALRATNDREVLVWYDEGGNVGKSWFTGALWERGQAYVTPATVSTVQAMVQFVASLYCAIESIKDGLVYDSRYQGRMVNIRGVKVIVMTNNKPGGWRL